MEDILGNAILQDLTPIFQSFRARLAKRPLSRKLEAAGECQELAECGNFYCVLGMVALLLVWEPVEE